MMNRVRLTNLVILHIFLSILIYWYLKNNIIKSLCFINLGSPFFIRRNISIYILQEVQ